MEYGVGGGLNHTAGKAGPSVQLVLQLRTRHGVKPDLFLRQRTIVYAQEKQTTQGGT